MNSKNTPDYPQMLAQCKLASATNPKLLEKQQGQLTNLSREIELSEIDLTFPKYVDNRGLKSGTYRLVDILKTLGANIYGDKMDDTPFSDSYLVGDGSGKKVGTGKSVAGLETKLANNNDSDCIGIYIADHKSISEDSLGEDDLSFDAFDSSADYEADLLHPLRETESLIKRMIEAEDMHRSTIRIESDKKSAFVNGFYLLRPLLQVIELAINDYHLRQDLSKEDYQKLIKGQANYNDASARQQVSKAMLKNAKNSISVTYL